MSTHASSDQVLIRHRHLDLPVTVIAVPLKLRPDDFEVLLEDLIGPQAGSDFDTIPDASRGPLRRDSTVEEALRRFELDENLKLIPLLDKKGRYTGLCASRRQLRQLLDGTLRPPRVGGLATPLGVYMTSGYYVSGAGYPGLLMMGVLFGILTPLLDRFGMLVLSVVVSIYPAFLHLNPSHQMILEQGVILVFMLTLLRMTPISGLHAAEHMTINAIECQLDIDEAIVREQPRAHLRCGTNLVVLITGLMLGALFLAGSLTKLSWLGQAIYTIGWTWLVFKTWRPAGLWLQQHFTTRPPTSAQLQSGIRAGRELLEHYSAHPHPMPGFGRRLLGSGLPYMALAFMLTAWLVDFLLQKLGV